MDIRGPRASLLPQSPTHRILPLAAARAEAPVLTAAGALDSWLGKTRL